MNRYAAMPSQDMLDKRERHCHQVFPDMENGINSRDINAMRCIFSFLAISQPQNVPGIFVEPFRTVGYI